FDAVLVVEILVGRSRSKGMLLVAPCPRHDLRLVDLGRRARLVLLRAAVVDPLLNELDVLAGHRFAVPRQAGELRAVERALAAKPEDQTRRGAAARRGP